MATVLREHDPQAFQVGEVVRRDLGTCEVPEHGPEFGLIVEGEPVVDAPQFSVVPDQAVLRLAVGIVVQKIEQAQATKFQQLNLAALMRLDEQLKRPGAVRALTTSPWEAPRSTPGCR